MNFARLKQTVAKHYAALDAAHRWDHAERIAKRALAWVDAEDEAGDIDRDQVTALSYLMTLGQPVWQQVDLRAAIEATFVEQGWTPLRTRELMRALERLPDKPKTDEEKLVADADTMERLGLLGLVRHVATHAAAGDELSGAVNSARKSLTRRVFTRTAGRESIAARDELRGLLKQLEELLAAR